MRWRELWHPNIISLCITYGIIRYGTNITITLIAMYAVSTFKWSVNLLSWMTIAGGFSGFLMITILIRCNVFKGIRQNYFFYFSALNVTLFILAMLPLPAFMNIQMYHLQMTYFIVLMILKSWMYFNEQLAGKVLFV